MAASYASPHAILLSLSREWFAPRRAFRTCGWMGVAIGLPLALLTAAHLGLSLGLTAAAAVAGIAALLATGMAATILTGEETFVYFRDIPAIFGAVACVVWLARKPVLPYLDCIVLGATAFLACGRIGCLLVGCCHGRPSRRGIRYGSEHAACGFPSHYVGVRLFPIQAVESLFVFCLAIVATMLVWKGAAPGTAFSFYVAAYALGRFFIEFGRGDAERPYFCTFSEAQWTALLLIWALVLAESRRMLPAVKWHLLAAAGLILCMGAIAALRNLNGHHRFHLHHPHHLREVAQVIERLSGASLGGTVPRWPASATSTIAVFTTSRGIHLSGADLSAGSQRVQHYCLSGTNTVLTATDAQALAKLISLLRDAAGPVSMIQRHPGIFHLVLPANRLSDGQLADCANEWVPRRIS